MHVFYLCVFDTKHDFIIIIVQQLVFDTRFLGHEPSWDTLRGVQACSYNYTAASWFEAISSGRLGSVSLRGSMRAAVKENSTGSSHANYKN